MTLVDLSAIRLDGGTQPRASIFHDTVEEYVEGMGRGDVFPPLVTFYDGTDYWLADGFHRHHAFRGLGVVAVECDVRQGTRRDAILYAVGANSDHGRPRTNDDKRRAVRLLLDDPEWSGWSDREIGRRCRVSGPFVAKLRPPEPTANDCRPPERTFERGGVTATMKVANIGRRADEKELATAWNAAGPGARQRFRDEVLDSPAGGGGDVGQCPTLSDNCAQSHTSPDPTRPALITDLDPNWVTGADAAALVFDIEEAFAKLGSPEDVARNFPLSFIHAFSADRAREIEDWFARFGKAWARQHGERRVAA